MKTLEDNGRKGEGNILLRGKIKPVTGQKEEKKEAKEIEEGQAFVFVSI